MTRARITQIMNLQHLASPIQEEILHWPDRSSQREPVSERALRGMTQIPSCRNNWSCGVNSSLQLPGQPVSRLLKSTLSLIRFRFVARDHNQHSFL